ncbi:PKD domain-containing protein [Shewanella colwelliana]|uniref:PKD domain-containing protein n=1 Tax=Shewanella colwelliana TaxID=23 RepID=UPI003735B951
MKKILLLALLLSPLQAVADARWDAIVDVYDHFFGDKDSIQSVLDRTTPEPIWEGYYFTENNYFMKQGKYSSNEWYYNDTFMIWEKWGESHRLLCTDEDVYKEVPFVSDPSGYFSYYNTRNKKSFTIKEYTANEGVPFVIHAHEHGGVTDLLTDSYYFFSYGDGMKQYNKKGDDREGVHTYLRTGEYDISSIVYVNEFVFFVSYGGSLKGDFSGANGSWNFKLDTSDDLYRESCDTARVKVLPNNAPTAKIRYSRVEGKRTTTVFLNGSSSADPDGNPLTYKWTVNGQTVYGKNASISLPTPGIRSKTYPITLVVSDGGLSDSTNSSVAIFPYCYRCNGEMIP